MVWMPPAATDVDIVQGRIRRARYKCRTVEDVDGHLRWLAKWLVKAVDQAPVEFVAQYVVDYRADVDALLDARYTLMARDQ